jgi:hypothetical protein
MILLALQFVVFVALAVVFLLVLSVSIMAINYAWNLFKKALKGI